MSTPGKPTAKAEARAQAQRERILVAAQKCFVVHGFHAASMANIAETAGMSAGLIYRYFKGKNDIILAIIERQLEEARSDIAKLHATSDLVAGIAEVFQQWQANDPNITSAALFLELTAEATRDAFQPVLTRAGYGPITTEIAPLEKFYFAEDYHQQYLSDAKNPNGYCGMGGTGVSCPVGVARAE